MPLDEIDIENLAIAVGSAGRTGDMAEDARLTLGAGLQVRLTPAIGAAAEFLLMLGSASFWSCHV